MMSMQFKDRREFLRDIAVVAGGLSLPTPCYSQTVHVEDAASHKINVGFIGCGGRGADNLSGMATENVIALCDVDGVRA